MGGLPAAPSPWTVAPARSRPAGSDAALGRLSAFLAGAPSPSQSKDTQGSTGFFLVCWAGVVFQAWPPPACPLPGTAAALQRHWVCRSRAWPRCPAALSPLPAQGGDPVPLALQGAASAEEQRALDRKLKKERKKEARRLLREASIPAAQSPPVRPSGAELALDYLCSWAQQRGNWRFQKTRQTWLLVHMYDSDQVALPRPLPSQPGAAAPPPCPHSRGDRACVCESCSQRPGLPAARASVPRTALSPGSRCPCADGGVAVGWTACPPSHLPLPGALCHQLVPGPLRPPGACPGAGFRLARVRFSCLLWPLVCSVTLLGHRCLVLGREVTTLFSCKGFPAPVVTFSL
uniref:WKF domain-containing protein n=1 Tax=Catagonus wagneri TaxID=51154 RepID=A0A8C3YKX7_9CETA